ncbi:HCP-like protein [Gonapodya prolifera JEL478]|uniref:HCP-like protein n=1 Tax=Gonapodya prolifera (strain JEL478) TaxID=1344416 RepID=A0A139A4M5_GONPJ|nr:HCP-like protein [Gonapodya prolifera JEL478]|eukprot:KXS11445.1 HCP-like protein [Gonapodya prolifera JEL478]
MLMHQIGVKWDYEEAVKWLHKATEEQTGTLALVLLAECYVGGLGVDANIKNAENLLAKAADLGNGDAQFNMGMVCESRNNFERARWWYECAVKQGHVGAMTHLGDLLFHGLGGPKQDENKAVEWYSTATSSGYQGAFQRLVECYKNGYGVKKDWHRALELFDRAGGLLDRHPRFDRSNLGFSATPLLGRIAPRVRKAIEDIWNGADSLDLSRSGLRLDGIIGLVDTLSVNTKVITLNLANNFIGDDGTRALAEGLSTGLNILTNLNLSNNKIGDDGAKVFAEGLKGMRDLTALNLSGKLRKLSS